ncbi:hypothetical protein EON71_01070 [bacterium]|nr:MAG: hypothetical protein EON71_01070 [bacterium]
MVDRCDGLVNNTFFREDVFLSPVGKDKLLDYGKHLIDTEKKIPAITPYEDFEYVNHECY